MGPMDKVDIERTLRPKPQTLNLPKAETRNPKLHPKPAETLNPKALRPKH